MDDDIDAAQLRAARALVNWSRDDLADKAGVTKRTIARIEDEDTVPRPETVQAIRKALKGAGIRFIPENGGGAGVRLAKRKGKR